MNEEIIELYLEIKKSYRKKFPNKTWVGSEGKENCIILFKYLTKEFKTKKFLKSLNVKFFRKNHLYIPLRNFFDGNIFSIIDYCYPGIISIFEMNSLPKNFWSKRENLKKAFLFHTKNLSKSEILNLKKEWFYKNNLSTPLSKYYRNSPYLYINDIYGVENIELLRERKFKGFWSKEISKDFFIKNCRKKKYRKVYC